MLKQPLYIKIANIIHDQISNKTFMPGEKLPSIRMISRTYSVSINTVKQAFLELEARSLVEPKLRSGYFASSFSANSRAIPSTGKLNLGDEQQNPQDLIDKVYDTLGKKDMRQLSLSFADKSMLPIARLNKGIISALGRIEDSGTSYEPMQGSLNLRRNIAKWSLVMEGKIKEDDIVTTAGTTNAIFSCLMAVTQRGDTIAVETPVYFGIIQIAYSLGLNVIELPTHPRTGVELDELAKVIPKIKACCLIPNFSNPLGSLMPDENKRELVRMLTEHNIPLIEDDIFGNLFFGSSRPKPCKAFDEAGIVMWCSSVSKTLAPGYRVAWVAPGKFKEKIIRQKLLQTSSTPSLFQEVIADFLENGRYDHHLRSFRNILRTNCANFQRTVADYFPESTKISQPQGGFVLWLELDPKIDTAILFDLAIKQNISFAPGRMFTQYDRYKNCMRLNFALHWDEGLENDLKRLGKLVKSQL